MVIGHLALAYVARSRWRRSTLLPLLVASIIPDLADFALPQGDKCRTACALYTHAVPAVFVLAAAAAALAWYIFHRRATTALVAGLVLAHVAMDLVTGYKPYWPGGPPLGMQLFAAPVTDFVVEASLMSGAFLMLRRTGDAPGAAVHPATLAGLIVLQAGFDWYLAVQ